MMLTLPRVKEAPDTAPAARPARAAARAPVIGLLTPYCGGNLGDAAIHEAALHAIRSRAPAAEVFGITLWPAQTGALHGIDAVPLAGFSRPHYHVGRRPAAAAISSATAVRPSGPLAPGRADGVRERLRSALRAALRTVPPLHRGLRWLRDAATLLRAEAGHIVTAHAAARRADLLVVNGGGQIDDEWGGAWGHPYALFKWALLARATRTPLVFLSVGAGRISSRTAGLFLRFALSSAAYRSYRDARSRAIAERLGAPAGDPAVPDLAFGLPVEALGGSAGGSADAPAARPLTVGVSPIAYLDPRAWPVGDAAAYRRYVRLMAGFVAGLAAEGHHVRWFTTSRPDRAVVTDILEQVPAGARGRLPAEPPPIGTVAELIRTLDGVDVVVASRLHGVLLSHVLHRPVLAIAYDPKVSTHMRDMGQAEHCLDIGTCEPDALRAAFAALAADAGRIREHLRAVDVEHRRALDRQVEHVLSLIA